MDPTLGQERCDEATKSLESSRDTDVRVNLNRNSFLGTQDDLKLLLFIQGTIEERQETLVSDIWPIICWVTIRFSQKLGVIVTVQQLIASFRLPNLK